MYPFPEHLNGCVEDASFRFSADISPLHKYYKLKCHCGNILFRLFISNKKSLVAICSECGEKIIIYDLENYPAAIKLPGSETFVSLRSDDQKPTTVFVMYEYGPIDDGEQFDRNDISWCQVFTEPDSGSLEKVFDDETA